MNFSAHHHIKIILIETSHPGNIGSAARAMKTMGQTRLCLVRPGMYPSAEATALASGADDVLAQAQVFDSLAEAIAGCSLCFGVSARQRSLSLPVLSPRVAAQQIVAQAGVEEVAVLFGRERTGLTNEEIDCCQTLISIPANPDYTSLNLSMAVQIIAYELYQAMGGTESGKQAAIALECAAGDKVSLATAEDMRLFYRHLEKVLVSTAFLDPAKPRFLMRRLKRLFNRAYPDKNEMNILRGFLTAIEKRIR